jgi:hypothetical protein
MKKTLSNLNLPSSSFLSYQGLIELRGGCDEYDCTPELGADCFSECSRLGISICIDTYSNYSTGCYC